MPADDQLVHCPQCGYDLRGQTVDRCPECGFHYDRAAVQTLSEHALVQVMTPLLDALPLALVSPFLLGSSALNSGMGGRFPGFGWEMLCFPADILTMAIYLATLTTLREELLRRSGQSRPRFFEAFTSSLPGLFLSWRAIPMLGFLLTFMAIPLALIALFIAACWAGLSEKRRVSEPLRYALMSLPAADHRSYQQARKVVWSLLVVSVPLLILAGTLSG